jgi:hypothetical protein
MEALGKGHEESLGKNQTLSGMVDNGILNDSNARTALINSMGGGSLRRNFVMLEDGAKPSPFDVLWGVGLLAGIVGLVMLTLRRLKGPTAPPRSPGPIMLGGRR